MSHLQAPIRIVIADDHPLVRDGLRKLFELQPGFVVVGEADDGLDAVKQAKELKPDLLLLDLAMPRMNGLEVLKELADSAATVRTVLLTAAIEREETVHALRLGARGVVLKEAATQLLYKCIRAVMNGEYWVGHERIGDLMQSLLETGQGQTRLARPASTLTRRELQVVAAVVDGTNNREIGARLGITEQTVKNHLSNVFDKLGVSNRLELALYAVHRRLLAGETSDPAGTASSAPASKRQPVRRAE